MKTVPPFSARPRRSEPSCLRLLAFLAGAAAFLLPAPQGSAIPQTFSQPSPFILRAGKPAEDFFRDPAAWQAGAAIPGEAPGATVDPAGPVFGVNAKSIKLVRGSSGELQSAVVIYEAGAAHLSARELHQQLEANLAAFFGAKPSAEEGRLRFASRELVVSLPRDASPAFEMRITRAESRPAGQTAPP
jgi:hypothetical protein